MKVQQFRGYRHKECDLHGFLFIFWKSTVCLQIDLNVKIFTGLERDSIKQNELNQCKKNLRNNGQRQGYGKSPGWLFLI